MAGLLSDVARKNTESIAHRHGVDRQVLQRFIGYTDWDREPLSDESTRQVAAELGEADAAIVFDPSAFPKHGTESVGVRRRRCGRPGKTDDRRAGVCMGYVTRVEQVPADRRLYLTPTADGARRAEVRLPPVERAVVHRAGGVRAGGRRGAPHRAMPAAGQERGRLGRLPDASLGGMAAPSNALAPRGAVPGARDPSGEKDDAALTVPQVREALALILHRASRCDTPERIAEVRIQRLQRNEPARF